MIYGSIAQVVGGTPIVRLSRLFPGPDVEVLAKLDFLNPLGSSKDRVARYVIEQSERRGLIGPGSHLIESSSGNLGIALAALGPLYGMRVTCVVDPNICASNLTILRSLGAAVEMVTEPDGQGGYLGSRLRRVREMVARHPDMLWVNQYSNEMCWRAHAETTAVEVLNQVDAPVDVLAVAVSTTATLVGVAGRLRESWPGMRVVAVDAKGSVVFGGRGGPRRLPGLGSSLPSQLLSGADDTLIDDIVYVSERDAVDGCRSLLRQEGILAGASSGALVSAVRTLTSTLPSGTRVLMLLSDRGERYLDLVFSPADPVEVARPSTTPVTTRV